MRLLAGVSYADADEREAHFLLTVPVLFVIDVCGEFQASGQVTAKGRLLSSASAERSSPRLHDPSTCTSARRRWITIK
jgi:hypothetical protein